MVQVNKVIPHLWYETEASEAADFYVSVFENSRITSKRVIQDTPSGDCDIISFELHGQPFIAISAGPHLKLNPSISFIVNFDPARDKDDPQHNINETWARLSEGGMIMMPLDKYPFAERYGWVQDRYGLSWQLMLTDSKGEEERPKIVPSLLFVGDVAGKAEEARSFYLSVFKESKPGAIRRYSAEHKAEKEGSVMFSDFKLFNLWMAAMDSAHDHKFAFSGAISFLIKCDDQDEIDYYWEKLSAVPEAEQCGWLQDKFGISWQVAPALMNEIMSSGDKAAITRVTKAFLQMKKFDLAALERARRGEAEAEGQK